MEMGTYTENERCLQKCCSICETCWLSRTSRLHTGMDMQKADYKKYRRAKTYTEHAKSVRKSVGREDTVLEAKNAKAEGSPNTERLLKESNTLE